jgi:acetyl-CoA carboxylase carboxyltransferase component
MARRHASGLRSARENVADLLDAGSFTEYGAFAVAAQRSRRSLDDLQRQTPADGLVCGTGTVGGRPVAVLAYDYTVLAGTQGMNNHAKSDRCSSWRRASACPSCGSPKAAAAGRAMSTGPAWPACTAPPSAASRRCRAWCRASASWPGAALPATPPAGLLRPDHRRAGRQHRHGRAGDDRRRRPGQGGGRCRGPGAGAGGQRRHRLVVASEAEAVRPPGRPVAADRAAAGEAGARRAATCRRLRDAVPENRNALYDPRRILQTVADAGTLLELRRDFGVGVITALARIGGRAVALAASHPRHLGGALDAPACDKLARFMQLADAFGLPLVSFVDSPGFMVGPASEKTAMVRHAARLFVNAAALRVPVAAVVLRRGYGLGAMALTAGHFHAPVATAAWPTAEFGAMGLEGAVQAGLSQGARGGARRRARGAVPAAAGGRRSTGQALNMAQHLEIDDVIDPAETRDWLLRVLAVACAAPLPPRRPFIDAW